MIGKVCYCAGILVVVDYRRVADYILPAYTDWKPLMFGFDIYNFYSIAPSLAIVAAMIIMTGFGLRFIRQQIAKDSLIAQSK